MILSLRQLLFRALTSSFLLGNIILATAPVVAQMPIVGDDFAHDPSTMIKDGNRYYVFYTSQRIRYKYSTDLRSWTHGGVIQPSTPPAWTTTAVPSFDGNYWAPDVAYFNGKYHVYYSVSSWGTIDSAIGLVTSPSLISPTWTDQGKVVQSDATWEAGPETDTTSFNCIDPSILVATNGTIWMAYGSYSDGILVTQIDPATGKRLNPASIGTKIASSSLSFFSNTTEGAHIHQRGGFYYLFLNYDGCCLGINSTYNIRVGRSPNVTGPYLDKNGVNMIGGGGTMLLESTGRFIGPGHAGIRVENATNWFTYHYYDANSNGTATLGLTQLHWADDGWPVLVNDWSAFYSFDADAREHRALYSGSLQNGASLTNEPGRGRVLNLTGPTNYVVLPPALANASTFATWVKWNGGGDWQRIFDFGVDTSDYFFLTPRAFGGKMRFAIRNGGAEQIVDAPTALPTNSWVHVAVTLDGQRGILYLNGNSVVTNNITIRPWQILARSNYLGESQFATDPSFNGKLDSLRVFGRALSAAEIKVISWAHPALAHRYSFTSNAWDSIGMAHGTLKGNASIATNALKLTGTFGGYVDLPGGLVSGTAALTIEFWATFGANGPWARVYDFGNIVGSTGQNYLFFTPRAGLLNSHRLEISTTSIGFLEAPALLDNRAVHVVTLIDPAAGYIAFYTNGVLERAQTNALPPLSGISSAWSFIGRSLWNADAWLNATIDELRIYDGRLTPAEIAVNYQHGPNTLALPVTLIQSNTTSSITLSWPDWAIDFAAEATTDPNIWSAVTPTPTLVADQWQVSILKTNSAHFFRLKR